jgi:hypothetical protein
VVKRLFLLLFLSSLVTACGPKSSHAVALPEPEIFRLKPGELVLAATEDDIPPIQAEGSNFVPAEKADLDDQELVVGLVIGRKPRAYPVRLLSLHEVVNDQVGDHYFAVTWCPLCFSAIVFDRQVEGRILRFQASGYLLNDNLVLKDQPSDTLWSQLLGQGIKGALRGTLLDVIPSSVTKWELWRETYPDSDVLSPSALGYVDEIYDPYTGYFFSGTAGLSSSADPDLRLPGKALVEGIVLGDHQLAIPLEILLDGGIVQDTVGSIPVVVIPSDILQTNHTYSRELDGEILEFELDESRHHMIDIQSGSTWDPATGRALKGPLEGKELSVLPSQLVYWFAWSSFYPDTDLFHQP